MHVFINNFPGVSQYESAASPPLLEQAQCRISKAEKNFLRSKEVMDRFGTEGAAIRHFLRAGLDAEGHWPKAIRGITLADVQ